MRTVEVSDPHGIGNLRLVERPEPPPPKAGQVLVHVRAVSLNHRDLLVVGGRPPWRPPNGRIPTSDCAGEVVAVGARGERFEVGDRVISTILPKWIDGPLTPAGLLGSLGGSAADGVLADYVLFDAEALVRAPVYLSDVEAATLPCAALTAWQALIRADSLAPAQSVLVQGTGAVSLFALQFAAAAGARVIATSSDGAKLARSLELGASDGINYAAQADWDAAVLALTDGAGVDHVLDIGGASTLARSIKAARFEGVVSIVGLVGGLQAEVDLFQVFVKNLRIHGIETGSRRMLEDMLRWMSERTIRPVIDSVFPLEDVIPAFQRLQSGQHVGKVCISL